MPFQMNVGFDQHDSDFTISMSQCKWRTASGRLMLKAVNKLYFV